ncbi:putative ammonium transporter 3 [Branchiostoma floridae]|uniref:Ammonium transporter 3 n=1 Tax=Branchiostoma floridae TaxID=7739 RepID=A0A9J7KQJ1_BRAFL|nr:putative ammonium transporter 3 [Branchiostoma floridae]
MAAAANVTNATNVTATVAAATAADENQYSDDATWILTSAFIIFTMQSGFGLLESGTVSPKNEVNIMVKNASDVLYGGLAYWMFGYAFSFGESPWSNAFCGLGQFFYTYAFSFGESPWSNAFCGLGQFFVDAEEAKMGWVFSKFFFQMSFATTATTIVSGAMAERTKLQAYMAFCVLNTLVFCFPSHWAWDSKGWLNKLGYVDVGGAGPVHLLGGVCSLVATLILGPRHGRWDRDEAPPMGSPTNALLGMFMLWWGWLGFNCGSTFGITGGKWKLAARSAVSTITASMGGGIVAVVLSYVTKNQKFDISYLINGILGALVGVTGICALAHPWEGLVIGAVGSFLSCVGTEMMVKLRIDDPVGCFPVHGLCSVWAILAVGIFGHVDALEGISRYDGLLKGGGFYLLGVQALGAVTFISWACAMSFILLKGIDKIIGLRVSLEEELIGADICEHGVGSIDDNSPPEFNEATGKDLTDSDDDDGPPTTLARGSSDRSTKRPHSLGKRLGLRSLSFRGSFRERPPSLMSLTGGLKDQPTGFGVDHPRPVYNFSPDVNSGRLYPKIVVG